MSLCDTWASVRSARVREERDKGGESACVVSCLEWRIPPTGDALHLSSQHSLTALIHTCFLIQRPVLVARLTSKFAYSLPGRLNISFSRPSNLGSRSLKCRTVPSSLCRQKTRLSLSNNLGHQFTLSCFDSISQNGRRGVGVLSPLLALHDFPLSTCFLSCPSSQIHKLRKYVVSTPVCTHLIVPTIF